MNKDIKKLCDRYGLTYTEPCDLTVQRRRCGRGFTYMRGSGKPLRDRRAVEAIKRLAIPPAWTDVLIAQDPMAHLQAVGRDAAGRLQYRYHPSWEEARSKVKEHRLLRFGRALPRIRRAVTKQLREPGLSRTKLVAAVVRLIDKSLLRPGHEEYAKEHGARGAATLLKSDVSVEGDAVILEFQAKGGKQQHREVKDAALAGVIKQLAKLGGRRLFALGGKAHTTVSARDVNAFLSGISGESVSAKDFRTFRASAEALELLSGQEDAKTESQQHKAVVEAADQVCAELGNTRAVTRSSYIHPAVIEAFEAAKLKPEPRQGPARRGLSRIENALLRFFEKKRPAPQASPKP